jgi:hypothetical protein
MSRILRQPISIAALGFAILSCEAMAYNPFQTSFSQMNHGGVGLIQMPTARFNQDGEFSLNYQDSEEYRFWTASLQLFPWMETTIRYSDIRTRLYSNNPDFSGDQTLKDKGIDAKFRLWSESAYLPQLAFGVRDFGGTGLFESEYLAASKRWGNFDVHVGVGWGYLGRAGNIQNPFCRLSDRFCTRPMQFAEQGGQVEYGSFFRGPASLYGGIEYQTPWQPLRLKLEYDGNNYQQDAAGVLVQDKKWNIAATYRATEALDLNVNYMRGNTVGFGVNYRINFNTVNQLKIKPAPMQIPDVRLPAGTPVQGLTIYQRLQADAGFNVMDYQLTDTEVTVRGYSIAYRDQDEFITRMGRVLAVYMPETVKTYRIVQNAAGMPMVETVVDADKFVRYARRDSLTATLEESIKRVEPSAVDGPWSLTTKRDGFYTNADIYWLQTFGSPEKFYMYQGGLIGSAGYIFNDQWSFNTAVRASLLTNFDDFKFKVDAFNTGVPRVRTYVREYVSRSAVTMENMYLLWKSQIAPDWFAQSYVGMLETMYSGVGGEVLYRPIDSNLAWSFDLNYVAQRDYASEFGLFDYRVLTGHATMYWRPHFIDDIQLKVSAGRYLAKDVGMSFELSKRFDSGIVVGAFATKTDMSAKQYGEGSFTKGFFLKFPFDLISIKPSTGGGYIPWVPIARDGGQPLHRPVNLIDATNVRSPFSQ